MPRRPPPTDADAVARVWLDRQHDRAHRQDLALLHETPTEGITKALGQLSTGELGALSRHLTTATQQWLAQPSPRTPATRDRQIWEEAFLVEDCPAACGFQRSPSRGNR